VLLGEIIEQHGSIAAARARGTLSAFFAWAIREGIVNENPVTGTNNPAAGIRSRERVLTSEELQVIWNSCGDDDFGRIIKC
jgi:site-specific recombinase XerD